MIADDVRSAVVLEQKCSDCEGNGFRNGDVCHICEGDGLLVTEQGEAILDFIRRRIRFCVQS